MNIDGNRIVQLNSVSFLILTEQIAHVIDGPHRYRDCIRHIER